MSQQLAKGVQSAANAAATRSEDLTPSSKALRALFERIRVADNNVINFLSFYCDICGFSILECYFILKIFFQPSVDTKYLQASQLNSRLRHDVWCICTRSLNGKTTTRTCLSFRLEFYIHCYDTIRITYKSKVIYRKSKTYFLKFLSISSITRCIAILPKSCLRWLLHYYGLILIN
uniref:FH2 domain-containing protein n=1 Tax=Heterorhabditis bacteriophora TaxID=37862 RepID=A0A1I7WM04_HETBA